MNRIKSLLERELRVDGLQLAMSDKEKEIKRGFELHKNQKLWKYMDLPKFLYMLNFNKLYLRRLDRLEDNFEGRLPLIVLEKFSKDKCEEARAMYEERRRLRFVDCWTRFDGRESYAMWKIYSNSYGLAIETDVSCLVSLLPEGAIVTDIKYYDFRKNFGKAFAQLPVLWDASLGEEYSEMARNFSAIKSIEYEYEKEIRIILPMKAEENGTYLDIDVKKLIQRIIISPYESRWFQELVTDLVVNKYGLENVEVIKSDIDVVF